MLPKLWPVAFLASGKTQILSVESASCRHAGAIGLSATVVNPTKTELWIERIRLFEMDLGVAEARVFRQGFSMPGDPCGFHVLRAGEDPPIPAYRRPQWLSKRDFHSHTLVALRAGKRRVPMLLAFSTFHDFEGYFVFQLGAKSIHLSAWCDPGGVPFVLPAGGQLQLEELYVARADDLKVSLAQYAEHTGRRHAARIPSQTVTGWIDWQYYREEKDEKEILANAQALAKLRDRGYPLKYIMIDGGWCQHASEWQGRCDKFPSGMKKLSQKIRRMGFELGLWFAPYNTNVETQVARQHPEWLVKDAKTGKPLRGPKWSNVGECHTLDYSAPGALQWLRKVVRVMAHDWRIGYLKLDGPALRHYHGGRFYDPRITAVRQIRRSLEAIREACGDKVIVEGEGLYGVSLGTVDTQRVQMDNFPFWYHPDSGAPLVRTNLQTELMSAFLHKRWWHNHRENVILRESPSPYHGRKHDNPAKRDTILPENELRLQLSAGALGGGAMLLSDNMPQLLRSPERTGLIAKFLPHFEGGSLEILDPFPAQGQPALYRMVVRRPFEEWLVVGVFNWDDDYRDFNVPLPESSPQGWHAHEFWTQAYCGLHKGSLPVGDVPPHACRLIALRQDLRRPQLLGTNLHLLQGAVELAGMTWAKNWIRVEIEHFQQNDGQLTFVVPIGWRLKRMEAEVKDVLIDARAKDLIRIRFRDRSRRTRMALHWVQA